MAVRSKSLADKAVDVGIYVWFSVFALLVFYPFYYILINSLNGALEFGKTWFWPSNFSINAYKLILTDPLLVKSILVSIARTVVGVFVFIAVTSSCAFALRKRNLVFRKFYLLLFTIPMFFGGGLIPAFLNYRDLGIYDTFWVYILPGAFSFFGAIIFMSAFNDIPVELEEAATIDGANAFFIYLRIYLPLVLPVVATLGLFAGVDQWNSYFDTLYFTRDKDLVTLAAKLLMLLNGTMAGQMLSKAADDAMKKAVMFEGLKMATIIVSMVPVLLIYPFVQRYFIKGVRIGAIKG
jgi:putative aldouronate transport system permease protein